jgi:hypothetical protein
MTLADRTRLAMRFDKESLADVVAQLAGACPTARVLEGKPTRLVLGPASAKLLPPK